MSTRYVALLLLALALLAPACGSSDDTSPSRSKPATNPYAGREGQERYCREQGWDYVPETNDCKVP